MGRFFLSLLDIFLCLSATKNAKLILQNVINLHFLWQFVAYFPKL